VLKVDLTLVQPASPSGRRSRHRLGRRARLAPPPTGRARRRRGDRALRADGAAPAPRDHCRPGFYLGPRDRSSRRWCR
jgi:hypothetical protein